MENIRERRSRARDTQTKITAEIEARALDESGSTYSVRTETVSFQPEQIAGDQSPEVRAGRELKAEEQTLRDISDEAMHGFGAQIFVVQPTD